MRLLFKNIVCGLYENNLHNTAYFTLQAIALLIAIMIAVSFGKKIGIGLTRVTFAVVAEVAVVYVEMAILQIVLFYTVPHEIPIMNTYYNNVGRTFVLVPLSAWVLSAILKEDNKRISCVFAVAQPMIWGLASIPCLFAGCCNGFPCEWGLYNAYLQRTVFPTQIVNAVCLVSISVFVMKRVGKNGYQADGKEYPTVLILIGIVRFLTEFLMDNNKIVLGLSSLSFDSLVMCFVGIVSLLAMKKRKSN